ncbi:MAG: YgjV family protein [Actinomycetota bacterium]|nr:YgjV family protein [Actinomycetota bacterium]
MVTMLGWLGAMFALVAYAQTGAARFRQIALLSSLALLTFNVLLGIWSNVALESALAVVNVRRLIQLRRPKRPLHGHPATGAGVAMRSTAPVWSVSSHPG